MLKKIALTLVVSLSLATGCASKAQVKPEETSKAPSQTENTITSSKSSTEEAPVETAAQNKELEFKGSFTGNATATYTIEGTKGQLLTFDLESENLQAYVNVYAPDSFPGETEPLVNGPSTGTEVTFVLPQDGTYTLQVFQMPANARRNTTVSFELETKLRNVDSSGHVIGDDEQYLQVQGVETLPLYASPNTPNNPLLLLAERAIVEVKTCQDQNSTEWCEVEVDGGKEGWVLKEHLKPPVLPPVTPS